MGTTSLFGGLLSQLLPMLLSLLLQVFLGGSGGLV